MSVFWNGCRHILTVKDVTGIALTAFVLLVVLASPPVAHADSETGDAANRSAAASPARGLNVNPLDGPESASSLLRDNREDKADLLNQNLLKDWERWRADIVDRTGFSFGADYIAVGLKASTAPVVDGSAAGVGRFFGSWELFNRGAENTGSIEFKVEHRHSFTDVPPALYALSLGHVATVEPVFIDQGFRTTTLYWKQELLDDRAVIRLGFVDIKEYFDIYALASPWSGFANLAFSTGANTMILLPDGAFGVMGGTYLSENVYTAASIVDASSDPTSVFEGFNTFFGDFDTFKTFEIGLTGGGKQFFAENAHVAIWQIDASKANGTPDGWGVVGSASTLVNPHLLVFLRGGWAHAGGGLYEASVSTGFGYMNEPGGNILGVGVNWGRPNRDTFGVALDDQWTSEIFYRLQLAENLQVTPSFELLANPALNPDKDLIALFGIRTRVTF